jgi:phosphoribosylanthranilate isomerase
LEAGADAVGFIFAPSERRITVDEAAAITVQLPPFGSIFGVFADPRPADVQRAKESIPGLRLQFSGDESPAFCEGLTDVQYLKALHLGGPTSDAEVVARVHDYRHALPLFDSWHPTKRGGTGVTLAWKQLAQASPPASFAVSGGLTAENVGECIRLLRPKLVDVRSGVETDDRKDEKKLRAFVRAVREADAQT